MIVGLKDYGLPNIDNYRLNTNLLDEMHKIKKGTT